MMTSAAPFGPTVIFTSPVALSFTVVVVATSDAAAVQLTVLVAGAVVSAAEYTDRKPSPVVSVTVTVTSAATAVGGSGDAAVDRSTVVVVPAASAGTNGVFGWRES